jgi:hypothetical protein
VDQMPVIREAVFGRVLAHGGDADAVGKGERTKLEGSKQRMTHIVLDVPKGLRMQWENGSG